MAATRIPTARPAVDDSVIVLTPDATATDKLADCTVGAATTAPPNPTMASAVTPVPVNALSNVTVEPEIEAIFVPGAIFTPETSIPGARPLVELRVSVFVPPADAEEDFDTGPPKLMLVFAGKKLAMLLLRVNVVPEIPAMTVPDGIPTP